MTAITLTDVITGLRAGARASVGVLTGAQSVDLSPQPSTVRRQQHQAARTANLISHSHGRDPYRHVRILRE